MRKTITWATIVLLLVVSMQSPVVSRTTPYGPEEMGPNPDHPWGGDQNSVRPDNKPAATGIPVIDFTHTKIFMRIFIAPVRTRPTSTIDTHTNNPNTPQTSGTTQNPNTTN